MWFIPGVRPVQALATIFVLITAIAVLWTIVKAWPDVARRLAFPPDFGLNVLQVFANTPVAQLRPIAISTANRPCRAPPTLPAWPVRIDRFGDLR
jgi:hypothetical protein